MSENPTLTQPAVPAARPAVADADPYGGTPRTASGPAGVPVHGLKWTPLLSGKASAAMLALGVVVGIVGPVLLWFNFVVGARTATYQQVGFLLVLVGLGVVVISLPLLLGEVARLEPATAVEAVGRPDLRLDHARGVTGARIVALVGILVLLAGAFLMRPVESSADTSGTTGSTQGSGNNDRDGGNNRDGGRNR